MLPQLQCFCNFLLFWEVLYFQYDSWIWNYIPRAI